MADKASVDAPTLLISPHFDDAVLSCGRFMAVRAGICVLTALAGSPPTWDVLTPWDALCGFSSGDDVVSARLVEDAAALDVLSAHQRPVAGLDSQYGPQPERAAIIRDGIESALADLMPKMCVIPLGLQHPDHEETRRVAMLVAANTQVTTEWMVYEELPYGQNDALNEHHDGAFAAFSAAGFTLTEITPELDASLDVKAEAVENYASQLLALRQDPLFDRRLENERYWLMSGPAGR